jgi:predicted site-specific integrase-resolvase
MTPEQRTAEQELRVHTVRISEAMRLANVSRRTIYNWITRGLVAYTHDADGTLRIWRESLYRDGSQPATAALEGV